MSPPASATPARSHHGLILTGLLLGVLLAALDQTITSTAIPRIVEDLNGFELLAALVTAYLLGSTIVIPIAGKFSDNYGRRPIYMIGMATFLAGSALCGLAGEWGDITIGGWTINGMTQLTIARFVQGLGGGAIFPVALATIADLYAPSERGRVQGLFGAVFGLSSVIGPFVGGWIVDNLHVADIASWRWVFYVNLPVGLAGIFMVSTHFPRTAPNRRAPVDWWGIATLTTALAAVILLATWGGGTYAWSSPTILGLVALTLVAAGAFVLIERRASDPLLPLHLFNEPIFALSAVASVLMGASMFVVITFMPTYMQGVVGISATSSGAVLMPLSLSLVAASIVSGRLMKRFGYKPFMMIGTLIAASGFVLLYALSISGIPPIWLAILVMIYLGLGIGCTIQTFIVATQNSVHKRYVGAATSSVTLFRTLGATIGIAGLGSALNAGVERLLPAEVAARPGTDAVYQRMLADEHIQGEVARMPQLLVAPEFQQNIANIDAQTGGMGSQFAEALKFAFSDSIAIVWICAAVIALAGFLVTTVIRAKPLKTAEEYHGEASAGPAH